MPKQHGVNEAAFHNRCRRCQLLFHPKVVAPPLPLPVNSLHGLFQKPGNFHPVNGFVDIFHYPQSNRFPGIVELVIGGNHDENDVLIGLADLLHGFNSIDTRHLNIHQRNVRAKALRKFNHTSSGLGRLHLTGLSETLFNDKFQRVNHDSLIVRDHDFIHGFSSPKPV